LRARGDDREGAHERLLAQTAFEITEEIIASMNRRQAEYAQMTPRAALEAFVRGFFESVTRFPNYHQMILQQIFYGGSKQARAMLEFIRDGGAVHPRAVDLYFAHGKVINWFGGSSNATTHLLDDMHYRGLLRIARRESGTRIYAVREAGAPAPDAAAANARFDTLIDVIVQTYAPLPAASLGHLVSLLGGGAPQWIAHRASALARAKQRLAHARVQGVDWFWPAD